MNEVILIILMVCGQPDTFIVKHPNKPPMYTHKVKEPEVLAWMLKGIKKEPIIIRHTEKRGICV